MLKWHNFYYLNTLIELNISRMFRHNDDSDSDDDNSTKKHIQREMSNAIPIELDGTSRSYDKVMKESGISIMKEIENDPNSIMYNEDDIPEQIADLASIMEKVMDMINFMDSIEMRSKLRMNFEEFEEVVKAKYTELPAELVDLLIEDARLKTQKNFERIINMFDTLSRIESGDADMTAEYNAFTEEINEEYIYPDYNGKEGFRKAMVKEAKKKARKAAKKGSKR